MKSRIIGIGLVTLFVALAIDMVLVQPKDLAEQLRANGPKPAVLYVGYPVMYRNKRIPAAILAGPTSRSQGIDLLKAAAEALPRDRDVVLYCGCCPFNECPNLKPAVQLLKEMGFTRVRTLMIPTNFASDWVDHGYPVEEGKPEAK